MPLGQAVRIASAVALVLSFARVGSGQSTDTPQPSHGLFGPTKSEQRSPRQLDLNWSLYGAQDDNTAEILDLDSPLPANRMYSGANLSLAYTRRPPHKTLTLGAASATRYYPDLHRLISTRYSGSATFTVIPSEFWQVQTAGTVSYSPFYQVVLGASPGLDGPDLPGPSGDYATSRQEAMTYGSFIGARRTFNQTSSMNMSYELRYMQLLGAAEIADQRAEFRYTRAVSKSFALNLGYRQSAITPVRRSADHAIFGSNVDVGLGYNRRLFSSSRTMVSFTSGTSTVSTANGSQFLLTGSARLTRQLSRLWTAQVLYDRGVQVPEGTLRPFFSDTVIANLSGYFNRRVMFRAFPSYARGTVGIGPQSNPYNSLSNTTRVEVALGRHVALYLEHFYYRYAFANNVDLPELLAGGLNRQGARAGLTLWTPVIR
jgi:hypothetical protein